MKDTFTRPISGFDFALSEASFEILFVFSVNDLALLRNWKRVNRPLQYGENRAKLVLKMQIIDFVLLNAVV